MAEHVRPKLIRYQEELVDLLGGLYGAGATQLIPTTEEPSTSALSQRLSALIAELRVTREALLAAQRRTDVQLADQEVRLSTVEGLLNERVTTLAGQLDETQQRLLDQVKITAAQQSVIRLAIERLGKRYETKTGTRIYDRLHARFCAELGTPRYDALPASKYQQALDWLRARALEYLPEPPPDNLFAQEAEGLQALRLLGGLVTPDVVHVARDVLVLSVLQPRPQTPAFWERVAHALAQMHMSTVSKRYGWAHDNWLGSSRQHNGWDDDGFRFSQRSVCCAGWGSHGCRQNSTPANGEPSNGSASGCRRCSRRSRPA